MPLRIPAEICERARIRARGMRRPHNVARKLFVPEMLDALAREEAAVLGRSLTPTTCRTPVSGCGRRIRFARRSTGCGRT